MREGRYFLLMPLSPGRRPKTFRAQLRRRWNAEVCNAEPDGLAAPSCAVACSLNPQNYSDKTAPVAAARASYSLLTLPSRLMPERSSTSSQPGPDGGLGGAFPIKSRRSNIKSRSSSLMSLLCGIPSGQESVHATQNARARQHVTTKT